MTPAAPPPHAVVGPLLHMQQAPTREAAQDHARQLLAAGASPADVAKALAEWDDRLGPQVIEVAE